MIYLIAVSFALQFLGAILAINKFEVKKYPRRRRPISILKPMKGMDNDLRRCVESFLVLEDFPGDELIFCFDSENDPAYNCVSYLISLYRSKAKTMCNFSRIVSNPKINNIWHAYNFAKNNLILISDSNIIADKDYKNRMDAEFVDGVGVLTSLVYSKGRGLDAMMLNTFYTKWLLILNFFGQATVTGKSMLFERRLLNQFGGLHEVGKFLAEDFAVGQLYRDRGAKIVISSQPVEQSITKSGFWSRSLRWGVLRKAQAPSAFVLEPLGYGFIVWAMSLYLMGPYGFAVIGAWIICDIIICECISSDRFYLSTYFIRELLAIPLWFNILTKWTVTWRGKDYYLKYGGKCGKEAKSWLPISWS